MTNRAGHCLCGAIAYEVTGEPVMTALCHCPSCRRASGAPQVAWALFPRDGYTLTQGEPATFASSPSVTRGFCATCGTTLFYEAEMIPGLIDITIASLDDPAGLAPQMHIWHQHRLPWLAATDDLEKFDALPPFE